MVVVEDRVAEVELAKHQGGRDVWGFPRPPVAVRREGGYPAPRGVVAESRWGGEADVTRPCVRYGVLHCASQATFQLVQALLCGECLWPQQLPRQEAERRHLLIHLTREIPCVGHVRLRTEVVDVFLQLPHHRTPIGPHRASREVPQMLRDRRQLCMCEVCLPCGPHESRHGALGGALQLHYADADGQGGRRDEAGTSVEGHRHLRRVGWPP
mmetsp:Transcript_32902/g.94949  ORF Transcript_32902/g.94949 Transcript_32902/m.94949 type:complete len:212 (-) Transcript_32902:1267-1902(-)